MSSGETTLFREEKQIEIEFATVPKGYLMELEKKVEYYRGRVDGLEYALDTFENAFKGGSSDE